MAVLTEGNSVEPTPDAPQPSASGTVIAKPSVEDLGVAGDYSVQDQSAQRSNDPLSYPEQSQATTVFVLGLLGMLVLPLLAPFAWSLGTRELQAIEAGRRAPDNRQLARIGKILGIAMSLLLILFVVLVFGLILVSL